MRSFWQSANMPYSWVLGIVFSKMIHVFISLTELKRKMLVFYIIIFSATKNNLYFLKSIKSLKHILS